jgi:glycine/D-amino acid oxidase-like deaminating enzyme
MLKLAFPPILSPMIFTTLYCRPFSAPKQMHFQPMLVRNGYTTDCRSDVADEVEKWATRTLRGIIKAGKVIHATNSYAANICRSIHDASPRFVVSAGTYTPNISTTRTHSAPTVEFELSPSSSRRKHNRRRCKTAILVQARALIQHGARCRAWR